MQASTASDRTIARPYFLAPIHETSGNGPLLIGVIGKWAGGSDSISFLHLRDVPGSRVYLGAISDAAGRIQEWVEVWTQSVELRDLAFAGRDERVANVVFDQRWRAQFEREQAAMPDLVVMTGTETTPPQPLLIKDPSDPADAAFMKTEPSGWSLCTDDALLEAAGLPRYASSAERYLYQPGATGERTFLATWAGSPSNARVQSLDHLRQASGVRGVFNPGGGLVRVTRHSPLDLESYLAVLERCPWAELEGQLAKILPGSNYGTLQHWSTKPSGISFLMHGGQNDPARPNEILYLKLAAIWNILREVRSCVKASQAPLLNLSPSSFQVFLPEVDEHFPALWATRIRLASPGQAYPLKAVTSSQRYFVRLGKIDPSPYLPEGLGTHSFGIGSVFLRNVTATADGVVLEGTLRTQEFLGLDPHDLLWFELPIGDGRVEFYAHVSRQENLGPREVRFSTVPARQSEDLIGKLKQSVGTPFQRSPYEAWPLLSSPCDLFSVAVIAVRILLSNHNSNLPEILDGVMSFARRFGAETDAVTAPGKCLGKLAGADSRFGDLINPHTLLGPEATPKSSEGKILSDLWLDAISVVLRLFPGNGPMSYCQNFGDVPPLALETVFEQPLYDLESLLQRLRSVLTPNLSANQEIARVVGEELAALE